MVSPASLDGPWKAIIARLRAEVTDVAGVVVLNPSCGGIGRESNDLERLGDLVDEGPNPLVGSWSWKLLYLVMRGAVAPVVCRWDNVCLSS
jgi:hypothetical protein